MKLWVYGMVVDSEEPIAELEELHPADMRREQLCIRKSDELPPKAPEGIVLPALADPETERWPTIIRGESRYWLDFDGEATFAVHLDGRSVWRYRCSVPPETERHLLLDHVLPRALCLLGRAPLHATAVATQYGAAAFLGGSGAGKSAMAAALGALGCALISDDCLVLETHAEATLALPGYAGLRLHADVCRAVFPSAGMSPVAHYTNKQRVRDAMSFARGGQPLRAIYVLERELRPSAPLVSLRRLGPADATMALSRCSFRMDTALREPLKRQLHFFSTIAGTVPVKQCRVQSDLSQIASAARLLLDDALSA